MQKYRKNIETILIFFRIISKIYDKLRNNVGNLLTYFRSLSATDDIVEKLYSLLAGEKVIAKIDQNVVYRSLAENPTNIYSLLLIAGYLKTPSKELQGDATWICEVAIPNREILAVFKSEVLSHLVQMGAVAQITADKIAEMLNDGVKNILKLGIAFSGKKVKIKTQ